MNEFLILEFETNSLEFVSLIFVALIKTFIIIFDFTNGVVA